MVLVGHLLNDMSIAKYKKMERLLARNTSSLTKRIHLYLAVYLGHRLSDLFKKLNFPGGIRGRFSNNKKMTIETPKVRSNKRKPRED